eukprot:gene10061-7031_t
MLLPPYLHLSIFFIILDAGELPLTSSWRCIPPLDVSPFLSFFTCCTFIIIIIIIIICVGTTTLQTFVLLLLFIFYILYFLTRKVGIIEPSSSFINRGSVANYKYIQEVYSCILVVHYSTTVFSSLLSICSLVVPIGTKNPDYSFFFIYILLSKNNQKTRKEELCEQPMVTPFMQQREAVGTQPSPAMTTMVHPHRRNSHHHSAESNINLPAEKQQPNTGASSGLAEHNSTVIIEATPPTRVGGAIFVRSNFTPPSSIEATETARGAAPPPTRVPAHRNSSVASPPPVPTTNVSAPNSQRDMHRSATASGLGPSQDLDDEEAYLQNHHVPSLVSELYQSVVSVMPNDPILYIIEQLRKDTPQAESLSSPRSVAHNIPEPVVAPEAPAPSKRPPQALHQPRREIVPVVANIQLPPPATVGNETVSNPRESPKIISVCLPPSPPAPHRPRSPFAVPLTSPAPKLSTPSPQTATPTPLTAPSPSRESESEAEAALWSPSSSVSSNHHMQPDRSSEEVTAVPSKTDLSPMSSSEPSRMPSEEKEEAMVPTPELEPPTRVGRPPRPTSHQQPLPSAVPSSSSLHTLQRVDSMDSPSTTLSKAFDEPLSPPPLEGGLSSGQPLLLSSIMGGAESPPGLGLSLNGTSIGSVGMRTSAHRSAQLMVPQRVNSMVKSPSFNGSWGLETQRNELRSSSDLSVFSCGSVDIQDFLADFKQAKADTLGEKKQVVTLDELSDVLERVNIPLPDAKILDDLFDEIRLPLRSNMFVMEGNPNNRLGKSGSPPSPPAPPANTNLRNSGDSRSGAKAKDTNFPYRVSCADECSASTAEPSSGSRSGGPTLVSCGDQAVLITANGIEAMKPPSAPNGQEKKRTPIGLPPFGGPKTIAGVPGVVSGPSTNGPSEASESTVQQDGESNDEIEERVEFDTFLCRMAYMIQGRYSQELVRSVFYAMVEDYDRGLVHVSFRGQGWLDGTFIVAPKFGDGSAITIIEPPLEERNSSRELGDAPRGNTPTTGSPRHNTAATSGKIGGLHRNPSANMLPPLSASQPNLGSSFTATSFNQLTRSAPLHLCIMDGIHRRLGLRQFTGAHVVQALRSVHLPDDDPSFECHVNNFISLVNIMAQMVQITAPHTPIPFPQSVSSACSSKSGCRPSPQSATTTFPKGTDGFPVRFFQVLTLNFIFFSSDLVTIMLFSFIYLNLEKPIVYKAQHSGTQAEARKDVLGSPSSKLNRWLIELLLCLSSPSVCLPSSRTRPSSLSYERRSPHSRQARFQLVVLVMIIMFYDGSCSICIGTFDACGLAIFLFLFLYIFWMALSVVLPSNGEGPLSSHKSVRGAGSEALEEMNCTLNEKIEQQKRVKTEVAIKEILPAHYISSCIVSFFASLSSFLLSPSLLRSQPFMELFVAVLRCIQIRQCRILGLWEVATIEQEETAAQDYYYYFIFFLCDTGCISLSSSCGTRTTRMLFKCTFRFVLFKYSKTTQKEQMNLLLIFHAGEKKDVSTHLSETPNSTADLLLAFDCSEAGTKHFYGLCLFLAAHFAMHADIYAVGTNFSYFPSRQPRDRAINNSRPLAIPPPIPQMQFQLGLQRDDADPGTGLGPSSMAAYLSRFSAERPESLDRERRVASESRENLMSSNIRGASKHGGMKRSAPGLAARPNVNRLSVSSSSTSLSPAPVSGSASEEPLHESDAQPSANTGAASSPRASTGSATVSPSPVSVPAEVAEEDPLWPDIIALAGDGNYSLQQRMYQWAQEVRRRGDEASMKYKEQLDQAFSERCRDLAASMVAHSRQSASRMTSEDRSRSSPSLGRQDGEISDSQGSGAAGVSVQEALDQIQRLEDKCAGLQKQHEKEREAWRVEREALEKGATDAMLQQEAHQYQQMHLKDEEIEALKEQLQTAQLPKLFSADELQQRCTTARQQEREHWQRLLDQQQHVFESRMTELTVRHQEELSRLAAAQTKREFDLQKAQERRRAILEERLAEQYATQQQVAQEKLKAREEEVERLTTELDAAQASIATIRQECEVQIADGRAVEAELWRTRLEEAISRHTDEKLHWQRELKAAEMEVTKLQSEKQLLEDASEGLRKALETREWDVSEAIAAWQKDYMQSRSQELKKEEEEVRQRCADLYNDYVQKVQEEEDRRQRRLQHERKKLFEELLTQQSKEREAARLELEAMEEAATRKLQATLQDAQEHESRARSKLAQREAAVAEKEREYIRRLASSEADAVERGRAVVEGEMMKARVDLQQRYASLRAAQEAWDESSAAWQRDMMASFSIRFEKAKMQVVQHGAEVIRQLLQQQEEREKHLLQERGTLLRRCTESYHERYQLLVKRLEADEGALTADLRLLHDEETQRWEKREGELLRAMATSRADVIQSMEDRSQRLLQDQAGILQLAHGAAAEEASKRIALLEEAIRRSTNEFVEGRRAFEELVLQKTESALCEEHQRVHALLEAQREAYRSGLEHLQARWREAEQLRQDTVAASRVEERRAWQKSLETMEENYRLQCAGLQAAAKESFAALQCQQRDALEDMMKEYEARFQEAEDTADVQAQELRGMYDSRVSALEKEQVQRVTALNRRLEEAELAHTAQYQVLQQRLEAAYVASLEALQSKLEAKEKDTATRQRAQQLLVEEKLAQVQADMVANYDAFTQRLAEDSHHALDEHRRTMRGKQQELEDQLVAIRNHLSDALSAHLQEVETQELALQTQQANHLETEMQQVGLLLQEREKRKLCERRTGGETRSEETQTPPPTMPQMDGGRSTEIVAPPTVRVDHIVAVHTPSNTSSTPSDRSSCDPPQSMDSLYRKLQQLWELLEVPQEEQDNVHNWLETLGMIIPVEVSEARQVDALESEVSRLSSYIPVLEMVARREELLDELGQSSGGNEDGLLALKERIALVHSELLREITKNENYYGKALTYRGGRIMDLLDTPLKN